MGFGNNELTSESATHHRLFIIILAISLLSRLFLLNVPAFAVFDESVYVDAAYNIAWLEPPPLEPIFLGSRVSVVTVSPVEVYGEYPLGQDFNYEHPPLAKVIMAFFVWVFSSDRVSYFWARVPSVLMSLVALVSFYGVCLNFLDRKYSCLAVFVLSFESLFWIQSRIAVLDIYMLGFMLLGMWLYLKGYVGCSILAFSLSILSKTVGVLGLLAIVVYEAVSWKPDRETLSRILYLVGGSATVTFLVYSVLMRFVGVSKSPFEALKMMSFGLFSRSDWASAIVSGAMPISQPWNWLMNEKPIHYAWIFDPKTGAVMLDMWGRMTPAVIFLAIPILAVVGYRAINHRESVATFTFISFMVMFLPYFLTSLVREQFLHHMVAAVPMLVLGITYWLRDQPKPFQLGYLGLILFCWIWYYPYRFLWYLPALSFFG